MFIAECYRKTRNIFAKIIAKTATYKLLHCGDNTASYSCVISYFFFFNTLIFLIRSGTYTLRIKDRKLTISHFYIFFYKIMYSYFF